MKYCIAIIFILSGCNFAMCQGIQNTAPKRVIDSLIRVNELRQKNKKFDYNNYFNTSFYKSDTISKRKDSLVINYLTINNKLIRKEIKEYGLGVTDSIKSDHDSVNVLYDSAVIFYNKKGLEEYIEHWRYVATAIFNDTEGEGMGDGIIKHIQLPDAEMSIMRVAYDRDNRDTLDIFSTSEGLIRSRRYYDSKGNFLKSTQESIEQYQFWDE